MSRGPRRVRVSAGHPAAKAWLVAMAAEGAHAGSRAGVVTAQWARAHGVDVQRYRHRGKLLPNGGPAADGALDVVLRQGVVCALQTLGTRLRMPLATMVLAAMSWHLDLPPGEHRPTRGCAVVLPPRAWPGAPDDDVVVPGWERVRKFAASRPAVSSAIGRAAVDRRETPALLAFEARRRAVEQTAVGPAGFAALMRRTA